MPTINRFALHQVVVILTGKKTVSESTYDSLNVAGLNVEEESFHRGG